MKRILVGFAILSALFSAKASAQVLATAETGGKGNQAVFFSANGLYPEGLTLFNAYGQYVYGLTDRVDVMAAYGNISALGENQNYIGFGWNAVVLRRKQAFVDVSFFNVITVPLSKRSQSSTVLMNPALVVSRPIEVAGKPMTFYSGVNFTVPVGSVKDKLFTPPETLVNVPIGVSVPLSSKWILCLEADPGTNLKALGVGIVKVF